MMLQQLQHHCQNCVGHHFDLFFLFGVVVSVAIVVVLVILLSRFNLGQDQKHVTHHLR